jgi:enterochelin esterase-like enzyme
MKTNKFLITLIIMVNPIIMVSQSQLQTFDNTLLVKYKGKADSVFLDIKGGKKIKLSETENYYWEKSIDIENVDDLILQYKINTFKNGIESKKDYQHWFGKNLSSLYQKKDSISGKVIDEKIWSNSLQEVRKLTFYLPEAYENSKSYPIVYLADGYIVKEYANYVEKLIDDKKISKVILVGIHSGETPESDKLDMSKNKRTLEYLSGIGQFLPKADTSRYEKHMTFFCEEVVDYINNKFLEKTEQRSLYGFSNGASFSISASLQYPGLYANVISLSIGWELSYEKSLITDEFPEFYLAVGSLEKDFYSITRKWADILEKNGKNFHFKKAISFHDDIMWRQEFLNAIERIYSLQ